MISEPVQQAIHAQIGHELESAYAYLGMSAWCHAAELTGFASWLRLQAREEVGHAMKFFDYLQERNGRVSLPEIRGSATSYESVLQVFDTALAQERKITRLIHDLYELAGVERDYATQIMLQWFITEQVEEESSAEAMVARLRMLGDSRDALFLLDREAGNRASAD